MAVALTNDQASSLVTQVVADINAVIASGKTEAALYRDFERIFNTYADTAVIAASVLGVVWRNASAAQQRAFVQSYGGYVARKYGRRFRDFAGGRIEVLRTRPTGSSIEVEGRALLPGRGPVNVTFLISDRAGRPRFYDIIIEGIGLRSSERTEIGALLDQRRGDLDQLIAYLRSA